MDIRRKQRLVVEALEDVKGYDIVVFNTARMPSMFERVVIASGDSTRQVKALADHLQDKAREAGTRVYGVEGEAGGEWVLVDLGEIVVHIMHPTVRSFYNLEEVWGDKPVKMKSAPPKGAKKPAPKGAEKPAPKGAEKPAQEGATHGKASRRRRRR
jgi:ribosome-associated protein